MTKSTNWVPGGITARTASDGKPPQINYIRKWKWEALVSEGKVVKHVMRDGGGVKGQNTPFHSSHRWVAFRSLLAFSIDFLLVYAEWFSFFFGCVKYPIG